MERSLCHDASVSLMRLSAHGAGLQTEDYPGQEISAPGAGFSWTLDASAGSLCLVYVYLDQGSLRYGLIES